MAPSAVTYDSKAGLEKLTSIAGAAIRKGTLQYEDLAVLHDTVADWVEVLGEYLSAVSFDVSVDGVEDLEE